MSFKALRNICQSCVPAPQLKEFQEERDRVKKWFDYECKSYQFYQSSFQKSLLISKIYFAYRWLINILNLVSLIVTAGDFGNHHTEYIRGADFYLKYPVYLTHVSLILNCVQTLMGAIIITWAALKYGFKTSLEVNQRPSIFQTVYWKLMEVSTVYAFSISVIYWLVICHVQHHPVDLNSILAHGSNVIYACVDIVVIGIPYNFSDFWMALAYGGIYFFFTYLYWVSGGVPRPKPHEENPWDTRLYGRCTDWERPAFAFSCLFVMTCNTCSCHMGLCFFNKLRIRWMRRVLLEEDGNVSSEWRSNPRLEPKLKEEKSEKSVTT